MIFMIILVPRRLNGSSTRFSPADGRTTVTLAVSC